MIYREYLRELLFSSDAKKMANTPLWGTSYDLFTEYQSEASSARLFARRLMSFEAQSEIEFYILLDYLTFIPSARWEGAYLPQRAWTSPR